MKFFKQDFKTTGLKLKNDLGLNKFPISRIHRVIDSVQPTYFIYVDSKFPTMPITNFRVRRNPGVANFYHGSNIPKESIYTPLMDLEEFNGVIKSRLFVLIDLAGMDHINKRMYEKAKVIYCPNFSKLEEVTLNDLRKLDATMSSQTKKFKDIRQKLMKGANINTKFIETKIEGKDILFKFLTKATEDPNDTKPKKQVDPKDFSMKDNPSKTYEVWMKFPNALELLESEEKIDQNVLNDLIQASDVQLWSNDPSFHWQGFNYQLSQLDASIFPTNIAPKFWSTKHGENFLTKHLAQIMLQYKFFANQMAASLEKQLKK